MGLRMQGGSRRSQVKINECSGLVIPRCGPASPFKGHLSNKSNAFCICSSRNLASQYLIRDHMVVHYNRVLAAKAAVDTSLPKSRLASIKLADQQRREKLKKKIARCREKLSVCEAGSPSQPRDRGKAQPSSSRKSALEAEDGVSASAGQTQYLSGAASSHGEECAVHSGAGKCARKRSRHAAGGSNSCVCMPRAGQRSELPRSHSIESFVSIVGCSQSCHGNHGDQSCHGNQASGGDLLERHSECFTKSRKPFTPRTLISDAKPFLSDYRFYTPAQRRRRCHHHHRSYLVEAQTQTDMTSFPPEDKMPVRKVVSEKQKVKYKAEDKRYTLDEPERRVDDFQLSIPRETSWCPQKSSSSPERTDDPEEEELLYLTFIEEVTNEILRFGIFSNRVLDQLFKFHIEENKNRLDEGKMRQMLEVLKSDLGCDQDSDTEQIHADQEASGPLEQHKCGTTEEPEFDSKGHRLRKATKNEEFLESRDLSSTKPNNCRSVSWSKRSRETQDKEDFSEDTTEIMGAGKESDFRGVVFEEHPDTSPTCEAASNLFGCDRDFHSNKELDELDGNFAEALHISPKYS
ncbi:spermatogenesis-associated protein 7 isoform X1 [Melospiza georgiana]|uniref:spermatogenesis-associated protein 7 isoform X1 n=1 Tax=Melospiza georgiana TaxID=44398 RepID=UPI0025AC0CE5|nr:spermatogenesis-associated protein 7 isoform X1 [Melospiza georgiana]